MMQTQQYLQVLTGFYRSSLDFPGSSSFVRIRCLLLLTHPRTNTAVLTSEAGGTFKSTIAFTSCRWLGHFKNGPRREIEHIRIIRLVRIVKLPGRAEFGRVKIDRVNDLPKSYFD
uniref:Uncharacterized protein n=1 Tax=Solanum lycopersicum TaxID=4081 RepID=A0A3Q7FI74_SOLLC